MLELPLVKRLLYKCAVVTLNWRPLENLENRTLSSDIIFLRLGYGI